MGGKTGFLIGGVAALLVLSAAHAAFGRTGQAGLFVFDQTFPNRIWQVDETRPSALNPLVTELNAAVPEIELIGSSFYATTSTSETMYRINAITGAVQTIPLDLPFGGNVITAMESANGILYGGLTTTGGGGPPGQLVRISTTNGLVTHIGVLQGIDHPLAGMAFKDGVMYGATSRQGGPAHLFTIALNNGISTDLGVITEEFTGAGITLTGLEFGTDGVLYGLGRGTNNNDYLYAINPATRRATTIGRIPGLLNATAITSGTIPAPGGAVLAGVAAAYRGRRRRDLPNLA